jgi:alcohol dehydrogenase class IV
VVLTNSQERRKLALGARELLPDIAIVDPALVRSLPPSVTADTGLDALTHAIEGYTSTWHNDFSDGLCLKAAQLVFSYLPRAFLNGEDQEAREHMHNAAAIAGLGFGNSMTGLAHAMGHALGAQLHLPHGRAVSLCLPYTIQFIAQADGSRYDDVAHALGLNVPSTGQGARAVVEAIGRMQQLLGEPASLADMLLARAAFDEQLPQLIESAESDADLVASPRVPDTDQLRRLFGCAFDGTPVNF